MNIEPKTYNEVLRLARCLELKHYIKNLSDEQIEKMYNFIGENPSNCISVSSHMLSFISGQRKRAVEVKTIHKEDIWTSFNSILLTQNTLSVSRPVVRNSGGSYSGSGCSSCSTGSSCSSCSSGCSGNNNNNNG